MTNREGLHASYVGHQTRGRKVGSRCLVVSDEGDHLWVRWLTGSLEGEYQMVPDRALVVDAARPRAFGDDDEFGFEPPVGNVHVAAGELVERAGEDALVDALEVEGHLEGVTELVGDGVRSIVSAIRDTPSLAEIREDLGENFDAVVARAATRLIMRATQEVVDGLAISEEDGSIFAGIE